MIHLDEKMAIAIAVGISCLGCVIPYLYWSFKQPAFVKGKKKESTIHIVMKYVLSAFSVFIAFAAFISFVKCVRDGKPIGAVSTSTKEYAITKLTMSHVYFGDDISLRLDDDCVSVEQADGEYKNIVIKYEESYSVRWLFFEVEKKYTEYHLCLSDEVYQKLDGVIYDIEQEKD